MVTPILTSTIELLSAFVSEPAGPEGHVQTLDLGSGASAAHMEHFEADVREVQSELPEHAHTIEAVANLKFWAHYFVAELDAQCAFKIGFDYDEGEAQLIVQRTDRPKRLVISINLESGMYFIIKGDGARAFRYGPMKRPYTADTYSQWLKN